jgi:hypothetical protein
VTAVTIGGLPSTPSVGQSVPLSATATLPDGTRLNATNQVNWQSSATGISTVSGSGLLTIVAAGEVDVSATLQGVRGTAHLSIAPAKRGFDISGVVHESAPTENVLLPGTKVGIHFAGCPTCPHEGQETIADDQGRFTLLGIETAGFTLWARKSGYDAVPFNVAQLPRDERPDIGLTPLGYVTLDLRGDDQCKLPGGLTGVYSGVRYWGPIAVHRDGLIAALDRSARIGFSDGNLVRVMRFGLDGRAIYMPTSLSTPPLGICNPAGDPLGNCPSFMAMGGNWYYIAFSGDIERNCQVPYRETWVAPR